MSSALKGLQRLKAWETKEYPGCKDTSRSGKLWRDPLLVSWFENPPTSSSRRDWLRGWMGRVKACDLDWAGLLPKHHSRSGLPRLLPPPLWSRSWQIACGAGKLVPQLLAKEPPLFPRSENHCHSFWPRIRLLLLWSPWAQWTPYALTVSCSNCYTFKTPANTSHWWNLNSIQNSGYKGMWKIELFVFWPVQYRKMTKPVHRICCKVLYRIWVDTKNWTLISCTMGLSICGWAQCTQQWLLVSPVIRQPIARTGDTFGFLISAFSWRRMQTCKQSAGHDCWSESRGNTYGHRDRSARAECCCSLKCPTQTTQPVVYVSF